MCTSFPPLDSEVAHLAISDFVSMCTQFRINDFSSPQTRAKQFIKILLKSQYMQGQYPKRKSYNFLIKYHSLPEEMKHCGATEMAGPTNHCQNDQILVLYHSAHIGTTYL